MKSALHDLRNAIEQFGADCGDWPRTLGDLTTTDTDKEVLSKATGPNGAAYAIDFFKGPYLHTADGNVSKDPFWDGTSTVAELVAGNESWDYNPKTGDVQSKSKLAAIDGTAYNTW